jgi:hypothetical protein
MISEQIIEALRKLDPTGKTHVSVNGEAIIDLDLMPGYYDGPGVYIEGDEFFIDGKNNKIVIHTEDVEDFVWNNDGDHTKVVVNVQSRSEDYLIQARKASEDYKRLHQRHVEEHTFSVLKKLQEGYQVFQHISDKGMYHGVFYVEAGAEFKRTHGRDIYKDRSKTQETLCQGDVMALKESGFFEEIEEKDYIYWRLKITRS